MDSKEWVGIVYLPNSKDIVNPYRNITVVAETHTEAKFKVSNRIRALARTDSEYGDARLIRFK